MDDWCYFCDFIQIVIERLVGDFLKINYCFFFLIYYKKWNTLCDLSFTCIDESSLKDTRRRHFYNGVVCLGHLVDFVII